jgi:hypothetical protein
MKSGLMTVAMFIIGLIIFVAVFAVYAVFNIIMVALMGGLDHASEKPGWIFAVLILINLTALPVALYLGSRAAKGTRSAVTRS